MPAKPTPLELGLSFASSASADTGDNLIDAGNGFSPDFGNTVIGDGSDGGGGGGKTLLSGLVREIATGLVVAIAARFVWKQIK